MTVVAAGFLSKPIGPFSWVEPKRGTIAAITIESKDGLFEGTIKVYVHDKDELEVLVEKIKSVSGIQQVNRFDTETV